MYLESRSYSGKISRPKPEVYFDEDQKLVIIATPWGDRRLARKSIELIKDFYSQALLDDEHTTPFGEQTSIHPHQNKLYNAVQICHRRLKEQVNAHEYLGGVELTAIAINESDFSWVQMGHPNMFLSRDSLSLTPLSYQTDLSLESCSLNRLPAPLPKQLLGIGPDTQVYTNSFKIKETDRIILTSRSYLPKSFYQVDQKQATLNDISTLLSQSDPDNPFWLGIFTL